MSDWKEYKLGEISKFSQGIQVPVEEQQSVQFEGAVRFIRIVDFTNNDPKDIRYIADPGSKYFVEEDDLVMIRYGSQTAGKIARGLRGVIANNTFKITPNEKLLSKGFLFHFLSQKSIYDYFRNSQSSSTMPAITFGQIGDLRIKFPSLPTQTAIAEILSSLDDKIELNNKINQELKTLAQTLFKQWFIDFEFPNENGEPYKSSGGEMVDSELGEIPKGWEVDSLDNIAEFLNGLALQKFPPDNDFEFLPVIKIRELRQKDTSNSDRASINIPEKYIIEDGDVLFSWSGSLMIDFWTNGKGALNQHLFKVTSKEYPKWYYYLWTKHHLTEFIEIAESKATTMGHIQRQHLSNAKVVIPTENIIINFSLVFEPITSKIIDNRIECKELTNLRNTLLPKLISGELEINEIPQ